MVNLQGMGVALITPFKTDGSVDYDALSQLVDFQLNNDIDYMVVLGTTAETPTLTEEEKSNIKRLVIEKIAGRIPHILFYQVTIFIVYMRIQIIAIVRPRCFNIPAVCRIHSHSRVKTIIVISHKTGTNMTGETTLRLAKDFKNIIAIKEASGNMPQIEYIMKNKPKDFLVISGDDGIAFPLITQGASGVISVIGNAFPKEFSRMVRLALAGDYDNARSIHHKFTELFDLLFVDGNPAGVKSMLNAMGMIENKLRLPLVPTRITTYQKISQVLNEL